MRGEPAQGELDTRLLDAGAGELGKELRLNGELDLPGGGTSSTSLCLTSRGLYLVLRRASTDSVIDLLGAEGRLRYRSQLLGDRLEIDNWILGVPWRHGDQVRAMIGRARIRRSFGVGQGRAGVEIALEPTLPAEQSDGPWGWVEPFIDIRSALEREWLRQWLDVDERLLAFCRSDEMHGFDSPVLGSTEAAKIMVITERRQQLVAISAVGDLWSTELPARALVFESTTVGRSSIRGEDLRLRLRLGDEPVFSALAPWPGARGDRRLRLVARALWLRAQEGRDATRAAAILDELAPRDGLAHLARALLVDPRAMSWEPPLARLALEGADTADSNRDSVAQVFEPEFESESESEFEAEFEAESESESEFESEAKDGLPSPILAVLHELIARAGPESGEELLEWWREWELGVELGEILVEHLCELGPGGLELALPLHEQLRASWSTKLDDDPEGAAVIDFVLAEHLLAVGRAEQALEVLRIRREQLPSEQLQDLLPPSAERGGQQIRIELYELAADAHEQLGDGHVAALAELARLQPLVRERVEALSQRLGEREPSDEALSLYRRVMLVRELLGDEEPTRALAMSESGAVHEAGPESQALVREQGGIDGGSEQDHEQGLERPRVRALDSERIELLRHPSARVDGVLGRLQGVLAKVVVPDCSLLKSYCERANLARTPALARAVADATMILGLGGVEVFVSRGDKSIGMRAYEGDTSFLLIGGDHLDPNSDAFLAEGPLRFAIAAELAHLRYAHSRVTGNEVWAGTLDLGLTGLGMLIVAAPVLKKLKAPAKHILDKIGAPAIDRWRKKLAKRDPHSLANDNSQVIAAYRAMQLSADRAGLVACGDPRAAIRAMFTVHPAYLALWPLVASHGLRVAVTKTVQSEDERTRLEDLAVRVAALLSFYLSEDYAVLRAVAAGQARVERRAE